MPSALIEVRRRYSQSEEVALINAVHLAMVDSLKIKPNDKTIRLVFHEPHRFCYPPTLDNPARFTLITIDAFVGRSLDIKRSLYGNIVAELAPLGIPGDHILILLRESPLENWGIRGGQAACDVELGFKVKI